MTAEEKRAFLICPVRGHSPSETEHIVKELEDQGWTVHWPWRDTDQDDPVGLRICKQNREAIANADRVFLVWDGKSTGCLFDLGMAFALNKPLTILEAPPPDTPMKSFLKMTRTWASEGDRK